MNPQAILPFITSAGAFLWSLFTIWIALFIAPVYPAFQPDLLWIIVPIWLNFIITELYQERRGTNFGNAIQNGLVAGLIGIDWMRSLTRSLTEGAGVMDASMTLKFGISLLVFAYGAAVVYFGVRGRPITRRIGRIRGVTYVLAVFTPAIYGITSLTKDFFLAIIIYYPLFHVLVNLIDKKAPTPVYL